MELTDRGGAARELGRFGGVSIVVNDPASGARTADTIHLVGHGEFRVVVQKGRSFQRSNPDVPVLVDRGRYLVVELPPGATVKTDSGFTIADPGTAVEFDVERGAARSARADIQQVIGTVTEADLRSRVETLAALHTRHSLLPRLDPALAIAAGWLRDAGCEVRRTELPIPSGRTANVVGRRRGSGTAPRLFVVGAHLDSVNHDSDANSRAPGADDNASGSATVAAIAAAVAALAPRDDVDFILFGGEEQGLFGSKHYVASLSPSDRGRLAAMLNIDMAASRNTSELTVMLEGAPLSRGMIDELAAAAATYTTLATQVTLQPFGSDHIPFIEARIPAVLTIEGTDGAFEHEHTVRDTPDRLDFGLHRAITQMDVAWLLERTF